MDVLVSFAGIVLYGYVLCSIMLEKMGFINEKTSFNLQSWRYDWDGAE